VITRTSAFASWSSRRSRNRKRRPYRLRAAQPPRAVRRLPDEEFARLPPRASRREADDAYESSMRTTGNCSCCNPAGLHTPTLRQPRTGTNLRSRHPRPFHQQPVHSRSDRKKASPGERSACLIPHAPIACSPTKPLAQKINPLFVDSSSVRVLDNRRKLRLQRIVADRDGCNATGIERRVETCGIGDADREEIELCPDALLAHAAVSALLREIGRASCRERV